MSMEKEQKKTRTECDLLGCVEVPDNVLYGVQTMRGLENFPISKFRLCEYPLFIRGLAIVKLGAAVANHDMGLLSDELFNAISQACREIMEGKFHEFFPVDMIQGGAGTTTNMNANEVIANRALEIMGHARGEYQYCSPNDHVNCSQSTNDAYPSAIHLGLYATHLELRKHLMELIASFARKGEEFAHVLKMGRTQLQDAVPMTLGQTFHGFASVLQGESREPRPCGLGVSCRSTWAPRPSVRASAPSRAMPSAVRSHPGNHRLGRETGRDLVGATSDTVCMVGYSSAMKRVAVEDEQNLQRPAPAVFGSPLRAGRIQPAGPPARLVDHARQGQSGDSRGDEPDRLQGHRQRIVRDDGRRGGADGAQRHGAGDGPVLFRVRRIAVNGFDTLRIRCVDGITANEERCLHYVHNSIGVVTALNPIIGYKNSTKIAKEALETGRGVYELVLEHGILSREELDEVLKPENMIRPVKLNIRPRR